MTTKKIKALIDKKIKDSPRTTSSSLAHLENSNNLSQLDKIAARATLSAARNAQNVNNAMVFVENGKLIESKGLHWNVIGTFKNRKLVKGQVFKLKSKKS